MSLWMNFIYSYGRRGKEVVKKTDGNIIGKRRSREENRNYGVRILAHDDISDFGQVEIVRPDGVGIGGRKIGTVRKLGD